MHLTIAVIATSALFDGRLGTKDTNQLDRYILFSSKSPSFLPGHFVVGASIKIVMRMAMKVIDAII
jgi:hypothetical protein